MLYECVIFVLPYKKITNSGSLLLGMSFGKPVICVNNGSPSTIVKDGFGILYNKKELKKAMIAIKSKNLKIMGKMAYEEAKKYNWNDSAKNYLKAYKFALRK